ncbi:glycosyltransferase [Williamsia sp. MIQD14]|uniref:glycosyltransferase n=1 Tax=Williamsia sp. MIQD14 TaxID=3425703 RepID=UPI003DA16ABD
MRSSVVPTGGRPTDRPLRIALLGSSSYPICEPFAGGLEAHIHQWATALTALGHEVTLFAADGSATDIASGMLRVRTLELSEISRSDPTTPERMVNEHHAYLSLMLELAETGSQTYDLVHNHSLHYLPIAMSRMLDIPMLTTLHTPPFAWLESAIAVSRGITTSFAAVSRYTARQWEPVAGDVDVVFNGIATDRWPVGPGGDHAVWSGRLVPEKGPHLAIDAARAAGMPIRIAGPVQDERYFAQEIAPRLGPGVEYVGHLHRRDLAELVGRSAVALVTPVWDEPYGLVVAEALSCGTPVAAFDRGGIPEIVDASSGRLARPDDVASLAAALTQAAGLSRADARRRAQDVCSETRMVDEYLHIYDRMLTRQGAAEPTTRVVG